MIVIDMTRGLDADRRAQLDAENAAQRAYVSGAVRMSQLELQRRKDAERRLLIERTKWGVGLVIAFVLGWVFAGMQP